MDRLTRATRAVVDQAKADLYAFFSTWDMSQPDAMRNALLEIVPAITAEYGDAAAEAATLWYEEVRDAARVSGGFAARPAAGVPAAVVEENVRYAAGQIFIGNPERALGIIASAIGRHIANQARGTIEENVRRDPSGPSYARVPSGAKTCAWCEMLASRGFVYYNAETAGALGQFHDDCDCQIVPEFRKGKPRIEGYDPDAYRERYMKAREVAGSGDQNEIAAAMRRLYPDQYTDGVHEH